MAEDSVEDHAGNTLRMNLMYVSRVAEQIAQLHQNRLRAAAERSAQEARDLQNRLDTERLAARAQLAVVAQTEWWDEANTEDITEAWQTAEVWRELDPQIARYGETIESELQSRFGIDVREVDISESDFRAHLEARRNGLAAAENEAAQGKADELEAIELLIEADVLSRSVDGGFIEPEQLDGDLKQEAELRAKAASLKESAEGHYLTADAYRHIASDEGREAKMVADRGHDLADEAAVVSAKVSSKRRAVPRQPQSEQALTR